MVRRDGLSARGRRIVGTVAATAGVAAALAPAAHGLTEDPVVRGSVEQVHVTGANAGEAYELVNATGQPVDAEEAGELGGIVFRAVEPGDGYRVREADGGLVSSPVRVLTDRSAPPDPAIHNQALPAGGYGYLNTRDGTKLAINVHLPGPAANGPYPTLVEYSGYGYANPAGPESGLAPVATLLGFAVVDVNMRGTGCSGGAFDYFERLQGLDGYDVVEAVSRQPWARDSVGMLGISYGGISQLFVAATRPPSLAAITPLSVVDNTQTTLYPGGILNTGFALEWARDRVEDARPASPTEGQAWAWQRIQGGDEICEANQALHTEAVDLIQKIRENDHYVPEVADPLSPIKFVDEIEVPVFLACQWQDEQTGGHCPALARHFTGTDRRWFTFTNGTHVDSLDPATFNRWYDFLRLYVGGQRPALTPGQRALAPAIYATAMGTPGVTLPSDPIQQRPDHASALAAFEALPPVRVLFDNGAGAAPGLPVPAFERAFARFPAAVTQARSWYLGKKGQLRHVAGQNGAEQFTWDDGARAPTNFTGNTGGGPGGLWAATPSYNWTQSPAGRALSYVSSPLSSDTAVLGGGAVELWVRSAARNVDLQATVSEVRPDGKETFVQSGWLRTSARKLDPTQSTVLEPVPTFRQEDVTTLPQGRWVKVTIPLYYQGHVYRESSRIRVTISAPDGDQPVWSFDETQPDGTPWVAVAHSHHRPSRLVLPVVPGVEAPTGLPPCPSLRGQPCRDYVPLTNERFDGR
jgi:uncharacterized protein